MNITTFPEFNEQALKSEIVSYLNSASGKIRLGIDTNGTSTPDFATQGKLWEMLIRSWMQCGFNVPVEQYVQVTTHQDHLQIQVTQGNEPPYCLMQGKGFNLNGVYLRLQGKKKLATSDELYHLFDKSHSAGFEQQTSPIQNLTFEELKKFLPYYTDVGHSLLLWFKTSDGKFNNLGLLFSDQNPYKFQVHHHILDSNRCEIYTYTRSLCNQIEEISSRIHKIYSAYNSFYGDNHLYTDTYSKKILNEIICSCLAHCDWSNSNSQPCVHIFADRMVFYTQVGMHESDAVHPILSGEENFRNSALHRLLEKLHLIHALGNIGIRQIINQVNPLPSKDALTVKNGILEVTLWVTDAEADDVDDYTPTPYNLYQLNEQHQELCVFFYLSHNLSIKTIQDELYLKNSDIDRSIAQLTKNGFLTTHGSPELEFEDYFKSYYNVRGDEQKLLDDVKDTYHRKPKVNFFKEQRLKKYDIPDILKAVDELVKQGVIVFHGMSQTIEFKKFEIIDSKKKRHSFQFKY